MSATTKHSDVLLPSTLVGIETEGTVYRMDGVPLMLRKAVEPPRGIRSDHEILESILAEVQGRLSSA
jgi:formylmethanofuran dehydrogenase subunit B